MKSGTLRHSRLSIPELVFCYKLKTFIKKFIHVGMDVVNVWKQGRDETLQGDSSICYYGMAGKEIDHFILLYSFYYCITF